LKRCTCFSINVIVDASDPTYESQLELSRNVLREIGAEIVPSRQLLNKVDRVSEADRAALRAKYLDAILLSATSPADERALSEMIVAFFEAAMVDDQIVLPYSKQGLLGDVYENARAFRGLRHHRPDHEVAWPARRHRALAKNPRRFVS
jgi:GTPase